MVIRGLAWGSSEHPVQRPISHNNERQENGQRDYC